MPARPKQKSGRTRKTSYEDPERPPLPIPSTVWVDPKQRFIDGLPKATVANGKRNMPPWDDVLDPDDIEALWAYVIGGEPGN
jgi:mono/diheme cytochrome c family protein